MKVRKPETMNNTIKFILFLSFVFPLTMMSQDKPRKRSRERIVQLRKKFLAEGLELTQIQEERFWPIYDEYQVEMDSLKEIQRSKRRNPTSLSNQEAKEVLTQFVKNRELEMQLHIEFYRAIEEIIPARQILILNSRERLFHKKVFDKVRARRQFRRGD